MGDFAGYTITDKFFSTQNHLPHRIPPNDHFKQPQQVALTTLLNNQNWLPKDSCLKKGSTILVWVFFLKNELP